MPTQKTCFVIMGFGVKTDYRTGRALDLDKTYFHVIKPVFTDLGYLCFRGDEIKTAGMIDVPMYENILKADFVVADISTLNPNAIYELGVRHAVKNRTTIIIGEKELIKPFDLNHIQINSYEHMGTDIGYGEVERFRRFLKEMVLDLEKSQKVDSPLYSLFPNYKEPTFTQAEIQEIKKSMEDEVSLSESLAAAENAKDHCDFDTAISILEGLREKCPSNEFVVRRLVLNTYKSEKPNARAALEKAREMLEDLKPHITTNPETLGLYGAILKRLHEITGEIEKLREALWSYERGFYIKQDYYNGINAAFLHTVNAVEEEEPLRAQGSYAQGILIRYHVIRICERILEDKAAFNQRDDQQWIYFTLAEAHLGGVSKHSEEKEQEFFNIGKAIASPFDLGVYLSQKKKLIKVMEAYAAKYRQ